MKLLLDTHTLLWFMEKNPLLSTNAAILIEDPFNEVFVSDASLFEIAIKTTIGKLRIQGDLPAYTNQILLDGLSLLPIRHEHLAGYSTIPLIADHRDPFDRLLLATALYEGLAIITADEKFSHYKNLVNIIW